MRTPGKWWIVAAWCVLQVVATASGVAGKPPDVKAILSAPFKPLKSWKALPTDLRASLFARMEDPGMAEAWEEFQESDAVVGPPKPWRRLVFAAKSGDTYVIVYEHGGIDLSLHLVIAPFGDARLGHTILYPVGSYPANVEDLRSRFQSGRDAFYDSQNY